MIIDKKDKARETENRNPENINISGFLNITQAVFVSLLNQICYNNHNAEDYVAQ